MKRTSTLMVGLAGLLWMGSCTQAPPDTRAADEAAIRQADADWSKSAKDLDKFMSFWADGARSLPPNLPAPEGRDAIRKVFAGFMALPGISISWEVSKAEVSGDLGYTVGTYKMSFNDPKGKPVNDRGKYLTVWKRQTGGGWKVIADTFNTDLPAPGEGK